MPENIDRGDCVEIPDGRIARVRDFSHEAVRVRARRKTSKSHQFLTFQKEELKLVTCPKGWMSPQGYNRYLKITLEKMEKRKQEKKN